MVVSSAYLRLWIFLLAILIPACGASLQFIVIHTVKGFGVVNKAEAQGFPCGSAGKESTHNGGDLGSIPGFGRSPGEGKSYPLQHSGVENSTWGRKELDMTERPSLHFTS